MLTCARVLTSRAALCRHNWYLWVVQHWPCAIPSTEHTRDIILTMMDGGSFSLCCQWEQRPTAIVEWCKYWSYWLEIGNHQQLGVRKWITRVLFYEPQIYLCLQDLIRRIVSHTRTENEGRQLCRNFVLVHNIEYWMFYRTKYHTFLLLRIRCAKLWVKNIIYFRVYAC